MTTWQPIKIGAAAFFAVVGLATFGGVVALSFPSFTGPAVLLMIATFSIHAAAVMAGRILIRGWMDAEIEHAWNEADQAIEANARKPAPVMPEDLAESHADLMAALQSAGHAISDALRMSSQLNADMGSLGSHFADIEDERAFLRKRVAHLDMFVETARQGAQREAPMRQTGNGAAVEPVEIAPVSEAVEPFSEGPLPSYLTRPPIDLDEHRGPEAFAPPSVRNRGLDILKAEFMTGTAPAKPNGEA